MVDSDEALAECVRGHLEVAGPVSVEELVSEGELPAGTVRGAPLPVGRARSGLARLEASGSAIALPDGRWCARHLLVRPARGEPQPPAPAGGGGDHRRPGPLRGLLAARRRGDPSRGQGGPALGHRAVAGHRGGRRRVGAPGAAVAGGRVRPALARRALPLRRGDLGTAHAPPRPVTTRTGWNRGQIRRGACGTARVGHSLAGHAARHRDPRGHALDAGGGADRRGSRRADPRGGGRGAGRPPRAGRLLPVRARAGDRPAEHRCRRGPLGPGGPRAGHRRRLLGGPFPPLLAHPWRPGRWAGRHPPSRARTPARARSARASARGGGRCCPIRTCRPAPRSPGRRRRSWPRRWPGSCWPGGAWCAGSSGRGSRTGSPGET